MPPQPGLFAVPYGATPTHTQSGIATAPSVGSSDLHQPTPGSSSRHGGTMDDGRREKKRKESSKLGKELSDRRDDGRHFTESISALHNSAHILSTRPEMSDHYLLRLYPLSIERSSLTAQLEFEERYAIECAQVAYDEERERVEEEWRRGRERVRERLLEGIEERRRRAREEKEGEGIVGDAALDSHSRPPVTRKLRNKLGTSPPPTPHINGSMHPLSFPVSGFANGSGNPNGTTLAANLPITTGPFLNPHSLSVEDLPSPFPLPLTSTHLPPSGGVVSALGGSGAAGGPGVLNGGSRRRVKGGGAHQGQAVGGLGKSLLVLNVVRDNDLENDLGEIRRGNKRRRATAAATAARSGVV
ncbi:hypothetical protein GALMADRAFT_239279 [Galerina marginata CBS 339.88]|uniref:Uncharacterized protein n=1 Tax=Galerina marginata (strain CBS 339.88) TaxID=685588 RepID=A0A067TGC4_GALM3|nr:hypothetical protein GALMADRAFT_239279 [Galerina marginata CBS 339.88]